MPTNDAVGVNGSEKSVPMRDVLPPFSTEVASASAYGWKRIGLRAAALLPPAGATPMPVSVPMKVGSVADVAIGEYAHTSSELVATAK